MEDARKDARRTFIQGPLKVIICMITLWSFLFNSIWGSMLLPHAWAARTPVGSASVFLNRPGGPGLSLEDITNVSVPLGLGEIKETFKGTNGKTIIHIQDAHCNYAAQNSIADIIEYLINTYVKRHG